MIQFILQSRLNPCTFEWLPRIGLLGSGHHHIAVARDEKQIHMYMYDIICVWCCMCMRGFVHSSSGTSQDAPYDSALSATPTHITVARML